jgi:hypothetical protein
MSKAVDQSFEESDNSFKRAKSTKRNKINSPIPKKAFALIVFLENLNVVLENSNIIKPNKPKNKKT